MPMLRKPTPTDPVARALPHADREVTGVYDRYETFLRSERFWSAGEPPQPANPRTADDWLWDNGESSADQRTLDLWLAQPRPLARERAAALAGLRGDSRRFRRLWARFPREWKQSVGRPPVCRDKS
jgi:hypothetical protein